MAKGPADAGLDLFKSLVFDPLVKGLINKVIGSAAWLAWGPIAFLVTKVITVVADKLYEELKLFVNFQYIMLLNDKHHAAFVDANASLRTIAKSKGIDSPEFKEQREKRKIALNKFIRSSLS